MSDCAPLSKMFEPLLFVADGIFGTRSGEFGCVLKIGEGPDTECLEDVEIESIASRWENAHRVFDSIRISTYLIKRHGFEPQACHERAAWLSENTGLYTIERYAVLLCSGKGSSDKLRSEAQSFIAHLSDVIPLSLASEDEALQFFRLLVGDEATVDKMADYLSGMTPGQWLEFQEPIVTDERNRAKRHPEVPRKLRHDLSIGWHLDASIEAETNYIRVNDQYVRILTLKQLSPETTPDLLAMVRTINAPFTVCAEWKPIHPREARKEVESRIAHFHRRKYVANFVTSIAGLIAGASQREPRTEDMQRDESASDAESQLGKLLAYIGSGGALGELAVTFICPGDSLRAATETANAIIRVFSQIAVWLHLERRNTLNAWFAALPGGHKRQIRSLYATGENASAFAAICGPVAGNPRNEHLNSGALTLLSTREGTPYYLNLHFQDVGHFVVTGANGAGKTFFDLFMLGEAYRQYRPQIFVFDLKTSYESLALEFGGAVVRLDPDSAPQLNPFSLPPGKRTLDFLCVFVRSLLEAGSRVGSSLPLTDDDEREISRAIERLYEPDYPAENRQLSMLSLPRHLGRRMEKWIVGGQHGPLFDNARDDLAMADFQVFSFPALRTGEIPEEMEPLLLYAFHRASQIIYDPQRSLQMKLCLLDEAWRLLQSQAVRQYVIGAVKTWREYNGSIGLATQSTGDLDNEVLRAFAQNAATLMFLADPRATEEDNRFWGLNSAEATARRELRPKLEILIKRPDHSKKVQLNAPSTARRTKSAHVVEGMELAIDK